MSQKINRSTLKLSSSPSLISYAAVAGKKESEGPLASYFDILYQDNGIGQETWEKAESMMQKDVSAKALDKGNLSAGDIDFVFAGDLLNQCVGTHYGLRELGIPFLGLYGACSTMAESLCLASIFTDNGLAEKAMAMTSSHFCASERQFRFPLEYGGQRTPTAQWTVTGAGCTIVGHSGTPPYVKGVSIGKITDFGITDINNMGAAMAPAAADTLKTFLNATGTAPTDYDLILTGDLGKVGSELLCELLEKENIEIRSVHNDCGLLIYDLKSQDVHAGGSGCGCGASVLCGYVLDKIKQGVYHDVLFMVTGALMSPLTVQQGETIPGIAHLVHLSDTPW